MILSANLKSPGAIAQVNSKGVSREVQLQWALKAPNLLQLFFDEPWVSEGEWTDRAALLLAGRWGARLFDPFEHGPSIWRLRYEDDREIMMAIVTSKAERHTEIPPLFFLSPIPI